jgi:hypothetical protein
MKGLHGLGRATFRLSALGVVIAAFVLVTTTAASAIPASARATQVSGTAEFADGCSTDVPENFLDYPPLVMHGSLEGCWYTDVLNAKDNGTPSGIYLETGQELFIGTVNGIAGSFTTTYKFESKWNPSVATGVEVKGRCQHPIASGSGGLAGVTGHINFKDIVTNTPTTYTYEGHVSLP